MAVPDFQSMFVPFLKILSDGKTHTAKEMNNAIADYFNLTKEDREERLPSGSQYRLHNRVGWARTHLKHTLLIDYVGRGVYRITDRGKQVLASNPERLTLKDLDKFPEHKEWFRNKSDTREDDATETNTDADDGRTPEERIAALTKSLNLQLASELLAVVREMDPYRFEQLVVDLLFAMGYGGSREEAARVTKASSDEGIDGIINEDRLGLDVIYIQAKRWKENVGRKEIQAFVGALAGQQANKGVFITTSKFRDTAVAYAKSVIQKVILIDGDRLGELMIEYDIGVAKHASFVLKRIDTDYFEDG